MAVLSTRRVAQCSALLFAVATSLGARPAEAGSGQSLQEAAQNPIADLISVPFQNNFNFGTGERDVTQYVLNVQPVYPATLTPDWNLIIRPIVPVINQPKAFDDPGSASAFGLGDIFLELFFSQSRPVETLIGNISWGVGPTLVFPSATDDLLGSSKWSAGPGAVAFISKPPFTYGALVNQVWSYAGDDDASDINQLLVQPFLNYNLAGGWSVGTAPIITANWEADDGDSWTLPIGGGVGKLTKIGEVPVQANLRAYWNAVTPEFGADWQLQFQLSLLFPKRQ
jgi:hypothetical protein